MPDKSATPPADPFARSKVLRRTMIDCQIRTFEVTDQRLLGVMLEVPRELFLSENLADLAYSDKMLQLKLGARSRWLLPPLLLARLIQESGVKSSERVLDVAPGMGYSTALLAGLAKEVTALESDPELHEALRRSLDTYGLQSVATYCGPLTEGAASGAPYDLIFINGAVENNLDKLASQLSEGGRIIAIERLASDPQGYATKAVSFEKQAHALCSRRLFDATVPMLDAFRKKPEFTFA